MQERLDSVHITTYKITVPFETESPMVTSGLRIGTPAVTTRGLSEAEMREIAELITKAVFEFELSQEEIRSRVAALCERFPLYHDLV